MNLQLFGLALLLATAPAWGASKTANAPATAAVANSCVIQSVDSLPFGAYSPLASAPATGSSQIRLRCTKAAAYSITNNAKMAMTSGQGDTLMYGLFSDSALSKVFGVGGGSGSLVTFVPGQYYCFASQQATRPSSGEIYGFINTGTSSFYTVGYKGTASSTSECISRYSTSLNFNTTADTYRYYGTPPNPSVDSTVVRYLYSPNNTSAITGTSGGAKADIVVPFYGRVAAGQDVRPGSFSETVILTVTF